MPQYKFAVKFILIITTITLLFLFITPTSCEGVTDIMKLLHNIPLSAEKPLETGQMLKDLQHSAIDTTLLKPYKYNTQNIKAVHTLVAAGLHTDNVNELLWHCHKVQKWHSLHLLQDQVLQCVDLNKYFSKRMSFYDINIEKLATSLVDAKIADIRQTLDFTNRSSLFKVIDLLVHIEHLKVTDSVKSTYFLKFPFVSFFYLDYQSVSYSIPDNLDQAALKMYSTNIANLICYLNTDIAQNYLTLVDNANEFNHETLDNMHNELMRLFRR